MKATKTTRFACNDQKSTYVDLVEGKEPDLDGVDKKHVDRMVDLGLLSETAPAKKTAPANKAAEGAKENK